MRNFLERLKLLYRMQLKEYYEVIIAPDSKFSFEEHPKEQRAEMLGTGGHFLEFYTEVLRVKPFNEISTNAFLRW